MSNHCKCNFAISIVSEMLFLMLSILFIHFSFLRNQIMFKMKSDFNPIYPRSLRKRSWHVIHQIKSTHMDYLELKGFWNPSTYSWEKWGVRCHTNFGTHCRRSRGLVNYCAHQEAYPEGAAWADGATREHYGLWSGWDWGSLHGRKMSSNYPN